jgi:hypothetical protein
MKKFFHLSGKQFLFFSFISLLLFSCKKNNDINAVGHQNDQVDALFQKYHFSKETDPNTVYAATINLSANNLSQLEGILSRIDAERKTPAEAAAISADFIKKASALGLNKPTGLLNKRTPVRIDDVAGAPYDYITLQNSSQSLTITANVYYTYAYYGSLATIPYNTIVYTGANGPIWNYAGTPIPGGSTSGLTFTNTSTSASTDPSVQSTSPDGSICYCSSEFTFRIAYTTVSAGGVISVHYYGASATGTYMVGPGAFSSGSGTLIIRL